MKENKESSLSASSEFCSGRVPQRSLRLSMFFDRIREAHVKEVEHHPEASRSFSVDLHHHWFCLPL
jgi:hypothetical protein